MGMDKEGNSGSGGVDGGKREGDKRVGSKSSGHFSDFSLLRLADQKKNAA